MPLEDDAVFGKSAGFVGAQYVHAAGILYGVEPLEITFLRLMESAPLDRQTETIMGSISGVMAHSHGHREEKAPLQSCFVNPSMRKTRGPLPP